jgi:hypothetical protein
MPTRRAGVAYTYLWRGDGKTQVRIDLATNKTVTHKPAATAKMRQ